ncbi:MAG: ZIP family metal transporter [Pirellulales bacterium]
MPSTATLAVYCVLIVFASLFGGWLPSLMRLTHMRLQLMMSAVGGLMLGIGLFHLLPHAVNPSVPLDDAILWLMLGLLTTFFLVRFFHSHHHAPAEEMRPDHDGSDSLNSGQRPDDQSSDHGTSHHHHGHEHSTTAGHRWVGIFLGLSLHTLLDGVALSASVLNDKQEMPDAVLLGFAVFVGILLHKPLDSLSITALMAAGGWSRRSQQLANCAYATMCPIGAMLFYLGVQQSPTQETVIGIALAFSAGIFLCISMGDLLPELEFHSHDRIKLSLALIFGVVLAYGIRFLEPPHVHDGNHANHHHGYRDHGPDD